MGMFDFLKILQKPQSIVTGGLTGFARQFPQLVGNDQGGDEAERKSNNDWIKSQKALGLDTTNIENQYHVKGGTQGIDGFLSGLSAGWHGDIAPSTILNEELAKSGQKQSAAGKVLNTLADVSLDPLMLTGTALGAAGKLGNAGRAASTFGKLGEEATLGEKAAQFGRRFQMGMSATGEPISAAGTAVLGGIAESKLAPRLRAISEMLSRTPGNISEVAQAEHTLNPAALDMGRLFDPTDVASIAKNTGEPSSVLSGLADEVPTPQTPLPFPTEQPFSVQSELERLLKPKPKVLIDPMIEDPDIITQILTRAGKVRG